MTVVIIVCDSSDIDSDVTVVFDCDSDVWK